MPHSFPLAVIFSKPDPTGPSDDLQTESAAGSLTGRAGIPAAARSTSAVSDASKPAKQLQSGNLPPVHQGFAREHRILNPPLSFRSPGEDWKLSYRFDEKV